MTKRYAIIRLGALGDCIHVLPTLAAWHRQEPYARFVWIASPSLIPLLESLSSSLPITFVAMQKPKGWLARISEVWRLIQELRPLNLQGVLNLHPNALTWALSQNVSTGWVATYNKQKLLGSALQRRTASRRHAVDDFYEPLRKHYVWPELAGSERWPVLPVKTEVLHTSKNGLTIGLVIGVGNARPNRAWPLNHWEVFTRQLLEPNAFEKPITLRLIGGPDERPLADALMQGVSSPHLVNHCGAWTLLELAENLTRCDLVIGGDTGPLHVAGAVGARVLGLYAPTAVTRTGPLGVGAIQTLTPDESKACWPCEKSVCQISQGDEAACMADINPEQVMSAIKSLLNPMAEGA